MLCGQAGEGGTGELGFAHLWSASSPPSLQQPTVSWIWVRLGREGVWRGRARSVGQGGAGQCWSLAFSPAVDLFVSVVAAAVHNLVWGEAELDL